jgi:hypothetical protein
MICKDCKKEVKNAHANRKRCKRCAAKVRKCPRHNLTNEQIEKFHALVGKIDIKAIAKELGASRVSIVRYAMDAGVSCNFHNKYVKDPGKTQEIIDFYLEHGKKATKEKYPGIKLRSIVERYAKEKRQVRWEDWELIELAKFAGIISHKNQAKYFNRPNANAGSIKSAWYKKFKASSSNINGVHRYMVKPLLRKEPAKIETQYCAGNGMGIHRRKLILWVELEKCLKKDVPEEIVGAIKVMAKFQRWLHGKNVVFNINKMLGEI